MSEKEEYQDKGPVRKATGSAYQLRGLGQAAGVHDFGTAVACKRLPYVISYFFFMGRRIWKEFGEYM